MKFPVGVVLVSAVTCLTTVLGGCSPQVKTQGANEDVSASYSGRTLSSRLPGPARVPAVIAAAEQTLRSRGYAIQRSSSTEETGEIVANAPRYEGYPRVVLTASRGAMDTLVQVRVEPFGDQDLSRSVLDGVLQKLGL